MKLAVLVARCLRSALLRLVLCGALGAAALPVHAGMMSPCTDPIVLPGARVQVFILPYRAESELTAQGRQLVTILQRHVLFAALKYRSIGVEELTGDPQRCAVEQVRERVVSRMQEGQTAIFLWGRIFEQEQTIRLQSTLTFSRRGQPDTVAWNLGGGESGKTSASIPPDAVMFASRAIPLSFLQTLEPAQRAARRLHSAPDANSSFWELPGDPEARFGFEVLEAQGDWMHVRLIPAGGDGWIPGHALATAGDLKGVFPELYFVDGLIGYHELWGAPAQQSNRSILAATLRSFDQYLELAAGRAESEVRALAAILKGNARLRAGGREAWSTDLLQAAQRDYQHAQRLAPTSTIANNFLLACTSSLCARGACTGPDQLHTQFLNAIAQDPTSRELVDNLNVFYGAAQGGRIKINASQEVIAAQRAAVERAKSAMR